MSIFAEIYPKDMKTGENEKGKFKEMPVFFNDQFGNQLGRDMNINGYVNEGNVRLYENGAVELEAIYFEGDALMSMKTANVDISVLPETTQMILSKGIKAAFANKTTEMER